MRRTFVTKITAENLYKYFLRLQHVQSRNQLKMGTAEGALEPDYFLNLARSSPRQMKAALDVGGRYTRFTYILFFAFVIELAKIMKLSRGTCLGRGVFGSPSSGLVTRMDFPPYILRILVSGRIKPGKVYYY